MQVLKLATLLSLITLVISNEIVDDVVSTMNASVDPCQDFYHFACGGWITKTKLPSDASRYDRSFSIIEKHNEDILLSILKDKNTNHKLSAYYTACMDTNSIEKLGAKPLEPFFSLISDIDNVDALMLITGILHAHGISNILFGYVCNLNSYC